MFFKNRASKSPVMLNDKKKIKNERNCISFYNQFCKKNC